jgi:hypothetical protein
VSKAFGEDYESWEWSGSSAHRPAVDLRSEDVRPSRVDIAFDFSVPDSLTPDHVAELMKPIASQRGIVDGVAGQGGRNTRYFGAVTSDRRTRIYRKDWQDESVKLDHGPTLRVELVLKGKTARAWWKVWATDVEEGYRVAAGHVLKMGGLEVYESSPLPPLEVKEESEEFVKLRTLLEQYGSVLAAYDEAGIPIMKLARIAQAERTTWKQRKRYADRLAAIIDSGLPAAFAADNEGFTIENS